MIAEFLLGNVRYEYDPDDEDITFAPEADRTCSISLLKTRLFDVNSFVVSIGGEHGHAQQAISDETGAWTEADDCRS